MLVNTGLTSPPRRSLPEVEVHLAQQYAVVSIHTGLTSPPRRSLARTEAHEQLARRSSVGLVHNDILSRIPGYILNLLEGSPLHSFTRAEPAQSERHSLLSHAAANTTPGVIIPSPSATMSHIFKVGVDLTCFQLISGGETDDLCPCAFPFGADLFVM